MVAKIVVDCLSVPNVSLIPNFHGYMIGGLLWHKVFVFKIPI